MSDHTRPRRPRAPTGLVRALPPDDLDYYEALKLQGFTYCFDDGWWYARLTRARVRFLLSAGYRKVA